MPAALIRQKLHPFHAEIFVGGKTRCGSAYTPPLGTGIEWISLTCCSGPQPTRRLRKLG